LDAQVEMKTLLCLVICCVSPFCVQAQETFGGPTEGGGPGGSPATNCPCWRYPVRIINYRRVDLHPLFAWWQENYEAYKGAIATADQSQQPPDLSSLKPSPLPGWQRIKKGRFLSNVAYGWLCDAVIEDMPSHAVTNRIILRNPPTADKALWDNLVDRYNELKEQGDNPNPSAPAHTHHTKMTYNAAYPPAAAQNSYGAPSPSPTNSAHHHAAKSEMSGVLDALKKFPAGTNYTIDLFALKIGYIQDGSHRQVFDLGQMYSH
jgi:hypothetical protein